MDTPYLFLSENEKKFLQNSQCEVFTRKGWAPHTGRFEGHLTYRIAQTDEVWQSHPTFTEYEISNNGRIRKGGRLIKIHTDGNGYIRCLIRGRIMQVGKLVYETFHGPTDGRRIRFIDGNRNNLCAKNLCLTTPKHIYYCPSKGKWLFKPDGSYHPTEQTALAHWRDSRFKGVHGVPSLESGSTPDGAI